MVSSDWIHFLATGVWGIYGLVVGSLVVVSHYNGIFAWISVITAITGNSAHLVAFAWSKKGFQVSSQTGKT